MAEPWLDELVEEFDAQVESPLAYLARLRWPRGFECPTEGCEGRWGWESYRSGRGRHICPECHREVSVTSGTPFANARNPRTWLLAGWLIVAQPRCVNKSELSDWLQVSPRTAKRMLNVYRQAMNAMAAEDLRDGLDLKRIEPGTLWTPYVPGQKESPDDLIAWIGAGWPRGFAIEHHRNNLAESVLGAHIGELLFKYAERHSSRSDRFQKVIAHIVG
jgi:transposase-like protein